MSYTYLATAFKNGEPLAAFHLKHELESWCQREIDEGYPSGGWLALYRIRSYTWERTSKVVELDILERDGRVVVLTEVTP